VRHGGVSCRGLRPIMRALDMCGAAALIRHAGLAALLVLLGLASQQVEAADPGGDCCADLEERLRELEGSSARDATRKLRLTISGYVAQEITFWDDGGESNVYLNGLGPTQATHVKFTGEATIAPGLSAGHVIRIQNLSDNPFGRRGDEAMNQADPTFDQGLNVQMSYWYLASQTFGTISAGKLAPAAKSAAMFTDKSGTQIIDNYTFLDGFPQFVVRSGGDLDPSSLTWGQLAFCYAQNVPLGGDCDGLVMNAVRYDTPAVAGFSASVSWGEDDDWQLAGRYAGEIGAFKILLGAGYSNSTDEGLVTPLAAIVKKDTSYFQAGGYAEHTPTGLFVHGAYGHADNSGVVLTGGVTPPDGEHWHIKAGLRAKWSLLGATVIYGTYAEYEDQIGPAAIALGVTSSEVRQNGGGIVQELDGAAMSLWLKYRETGASIAGAPGAGTIEALHTVSAGALINF
jgi:hypothetical protein